MLNLDLLNTHNIEVITLVRLQMCSLKCQCEKATVQQIHGAVLISASVFPCQKKNKKLKLEAINWKLKRRKNEKAEKDNIRQS